MTPSLLRVTSPVTPLSSTPPGSGSGAGGEADERREPGAQRRRAEREEVVVEIVADGDDDRGGDARPRAAPGEAFGRERAVRIVVPRDDHARDAGRRRERAEAAGGERRRGADLRQGRDEGQHRLDPLADDERSEAVAGDGAEADRMTEDPPERLARVRDARLGGPSRIEPGALHAEDGAVFAGDGGDQRREPAHRRAFAIAKLGVIAQRREAAARQPASVQVALGMAAGDGAALPPQAARRFGGVVGAAAARGRRSRQGEEGARLVERRAQRRRAGAVADEVEEVAVLAGRGVGPLARRSRAGEADEERAPAGAVEIARHPVAAELAAVRQVAPADGLGAGAERGGDAGGGGLLVLHAGLLQCVRDARYRPASPPAGAGGRAASAKRGRAARTDRDGRRRDRRGRREAPAGKDGSARRSGAGRVGNPADTDTAGPRGGPRRGIAVAQLLAQLHPEAPEHVLAAVAVARRLRAPPGVAGRDLHDRPLAGARQRGVDRGRVGLALHAQHPAHRVHALRGPARVHAGGRAAPDGGGLARRRGVGDAALHLRRGAELRRLVQVLRGRERPRAGGDRRRQRREVAELAPSLAGEPKAAGLVAPVYPHAVILRCGRRAPSGPSALRLAASAPPLPVARFVNDDRDALAGRETVDQQGPDRGPGQSAQAASERRDRDGEDGAAAEDAEEVVEAAGDVLDAAAVAPVALGREVDDETRRLGAGVEDEAAPGRTSRRAQAFR